MNIAQLKIPAKHLKRLINGHTITVNYSHQSDGGSILTELHCKTKKTCNKINRSVHSLHKGVRIHRDHFDEIAPHGDGFNFGNVLKSIVKNPIVKAIAPVAVGLMADSVGGPAAGLIASSATNAALGNGLKRARKQQGGSLLGRIGNTVRKVANNSTVQKVGKTVLKVAANDIGDAVAAQTGSNMAGKITTGVIAGCGVGVGTPTVGLGGVHNPTFSSNAERMSYVRSKRKVGGSFASL
jgi:hypothetical protein